MHLGAFRGGDALRQHEEHAVETLDKRQFKDYARGSTFTSKDQQKIASIYVESLMRLPL